MMPAARPGQPPIGTSPATQPTQNAGMQAAAMQKVGVIIDAMGQAIAEAGAASEVGQALADCIKKLGKYAQPGAVSPAAKNNVIEQLRMRQAQAGPQIQAAMMPPPAGARPA